ncbi:Hybrid PKS-NRPS synthetase apdA [Metarhizium anisopliae]
MESVSLDPVSPQMPHQDHRLCFEIVFKINLSLRLLEPPEYDLDSKSSQRTKELSADIERLCLFYIQRILADLDPKERPTLMWYHQMLVSAWDATIKLVQEGCHPVAETSWLADKSDIVDKIFAKWGNTVDIEIVRVVGERSLEFLKRKESILQVLMKDNMAARVYSDGCGFEEANGGMIDVLKQISHKLPRANYLEIGAGTGSITDRILRTIGHSFYTYTYTDISPAFFEQAAERFSEFQGKTIFRTLDVESDVELQGFRKHAYDVVVASNVLHATASIKRSLEQARLLLKPGGFLLLVEITGTELMRTTFCTGFSGVELVVHDIPGQQCYSFIASQAVDDTVQQLRDPLEYIDEVSEVKSLLIVGGKTLPVFKALTTIQKMLGQPWRNRITVASDIETIDFTRLGSGIDVLGLQELDNALFSESFTDKKLKSLQKMFFVAHNILWLTHNRRTDKPACNMIVGMARSISKELPHLNIQLLDLDSIASPPSTARVILEAFLRLNILSAHDFDVEPPLWPLEPELVVEGTDTLIPLVQPDQQRNDRYNANLRIISKSVDVTDISIGIVSQRGKLAFVECDSKHDTTAREAVRVKVQLSLFIPGNGSNRGVYLLVGKKIGSDDAVVAISESNTSVMSLSLEYVSPIEDKDCNTTFLEQIGNQIIVDGLTRSAESKSCILLHNASAELTACFAAGSEVHDLQPVFSSSFTSEDRHGWITIHPQSSAHAIQRLLPKEFAVFLDCSPVSASASASDSVTASILATLPSSCTVHRWGSELTISLIRQKMPRLGGVANAAMILSDKLFIDMDVDSMNGTIKPKVDASKHLDSILADYPLDFFIIFSSALSVTGGHGQANYHAANMYMAALAGNRKHKGRTASVMHIGHVCDVGYFIRADMTSKDYVSRRHMGPISEVHVHHAFAEAIIAGKPNSGRSCEVGFGIEPLDTRLDGEQEMAWSSDPRFAHFLPTVQVGKSEESQVGRDDIKERIRGAQTEADVIEIVQEALVFKLESLLQLSSGSIDPDALLTKLGSDSLVAVEIHAWFLKIEFNPKYEPLHGSGEVPKLVGFRSNSGAWGEQPWKAFKDQKVSKSFDEFVQSISAGSGEQDSLKGDEAEAGAGTSNNAESEPRPESNRRDFKSACSGNALKRAISCTKVEEAKLSEASDLKAKYLAEWDKGLIEYENKHFIAAGLKQLAKDDVKVLKKLLPAKAQLFTMDFVLALDKDSPPFWKALVDGLENNEFTLSDCQIGFKKALSKTIDKRYTEFDSPEHALTSLINIGTDLWDTVETAFPANFWMDLVEELPTECRDIAAATTPEEKLKVANEGVDTLIQAWSNLTPLGRANDRWIEDSVLHPEMTTGQKIVDVMYDTFTHFSVFGWVFSLAFPDVAKSVAKIPIKRIDQHSYWEV